ncbi:MAG TPA: two-component sensor histidine kinase [Bacteroidetes bacterium]|nr:two-component sensor histidine kinase [Bacteroidota bacterium]
MKNEIIGLLSQTEIFKNISDDILQQLADQLTVIDYAPNTEIIQEGALGDAMFVITKGKVKVHHHEHTLAMLSKGEFFGEIALIDSSPRTLSVTSVDSVSALVITKEKLFEFLYDKPEVILQMMHKLVQRLRNLDETIIVQLRSREQELERLVEERTSALIQKNEELTNAMLQLQKTQEQLILQQKLASLGQLTAGIAHEIQNPLNFIINFSSMSFDLLSDILSTSNEQEKSELISDLKGNLEKINHHGKRADEIVKGMLMHSRTRSTEKTPVYVNKLVSEAINFSFQGMKGKSNHFDCAVERKFAEGIPVIHVVEQDISRVLLNLLNNAFYAANQRAEQSLKNKIEFEPVVTVETSVSDNVIKISVKDNGAGIPDSIKGKIFQPFFTTKPGTEGTGLGLSISYDIVHAQGGEMTVQSKENEFTEFMITLPVS